MEGVKPKALDDEGRELQFQGEAIRFTSRDRHGIDQGATHVTDSSIGDISDQSEGKEHPLEGTRQIWSFPSI